MNSDPPRKCQTGFAGLAVCLALSLLGSSSAQVKPRMMFADDSRGRPFSKDPYVLWFGGHPHIFRDRAGRTWLFFQGNDDQGKSWYLSRVEVRWRNGSPYIANP
jgi:hypothetical protein